MCAPYLGFGSLFGTGKGGGLVEGSLVRGKGSGRASRKEEDGSGEFHGVGVNLSTLFFMNSMMENKTVQKQRET